MNNRANAGFEILESAPIEDGFEIVLGYMPTQHGASYVTWMCSHCTNYFWGHYFRDLKEARADLHRRALAELGG